MSKSSSSSSSLSAEGGLTGTDFGFPANGVEPADDEPRDFDFFSADFKGSFGCGVDFADLLSVSLAIVCLSVVRFVDLLSGLFRSYKSGFKFQIQKRA
jgi:hypothetical protein